MTSAEFPSATRQFAVTIAGIDGTFATKTGGNKSAEATRVYNGGSNRPDVIAGVPEVSDVTCGRPYYAQRDQALLSALLEGVGDWRTTITVVPLLGNGQRVPGVKPRVYPNSLLIDVVEPDTEAGSGDPATMELTFAPGGVA